jgi:hypothetical protein
MGQARVTRPSLKSLREKFLLLAETADRAAVQHIRELEKREAEARRSIKELHIQRLLVAGFT